ncbi:unnamed protein product [Fusarium equiseti]|uniref:Uncharacterized protein n=1 Tax=Fusarium equiseti TaxID=61235 RepID=A0A8J2JAN7_FUSEQ|nr:unnamed protein product [Fusarium equiseti]
MENIYSHTTIWHLIQASPTMLSHYSANKPALLRKFIVNLIHTGNNDNLLQDALGILGFDATKTDDQATKRHFDRYTAKELLNPLDLPESERDDATIANLHRLFSRLGMFIEDYMGKATASDPVLEYLRHPPAVTYTNTKKSVTLDDLPSLERYRLFRAFLKYEVLCKVFDPRLVDLMPKSEWDEKSRASWKHIDSRLYESIHCVNEYVKASFGGLFARLAWAQKRHPDSFFDWSNDKGLLYPDNMAVSSFTYYRDVLRNPVYERVQKWSDARGFDLLAHLITHMGKSPHNSPTLLHWLCSLSVEIRDRMGEGIWGGFLENQQALHPEPSEPRGGLSLLLVSRIYESEDPGDEGENKATFSTIGPHRFEYRQRKIYRQRAWMFCDSARFYPPFDSHFPDRATLRYYAFEAGRHALMNELAQERRRRRSVEWQDYFTGRTFQKPVVFNGMWKGRFPENEVQHIPPFFNSSAEGQLSTFWRFEENP